MAGLATTMQLKSPKALLQLTSHKTILDDAVWRHQTLCHKYKVEIPLIMMLSPFTEQAIQKEMKKHHPNFTYDYVTQTEIHGIYPEDMQMSNYKAPPGHGELLTLLYESGKLQNLINQGIHYLFVSNIDNTKATLDLNILNYCITETPSVLMEVVEKSPTDQKGGILTKINATTHSIIESAEQANSPLKPSPTFKRFLFLTPTIYG